MKIAYIHATIPSTRHNAFIVEDGLFTFVGTTASVLRKPIDRVIDLEHKTVFPGFHDSHLHVLGLGMVRAQFDASLYDTIPKLIDAASQETGDAIIGRGFKESQFQEKRVLTKQDLNQVREDIPVIIYRVCGHLVVANDAAIRKVQAMNKPLPQDKASYDFEKGLFKEEAIAWIRNAIPEVSDETLEAWILDAQAYLHHLGVTAVGSDDFSMLEIPYERVHNVFKRLDQNGKLTLRVLEQANLPKLEDLKRYIASKDAYFVGNRYKSGPLKLLADGSLGARTAYLRDVYSDDATTRGIQVFSQDTLETLFQTASNAGMDIAVHGIGDGIIDSILDAFETLESVQTNNHRHSIIHAQLAPFDQIERMASLKIGAQTQPIFIDADIDIVESRLGERANTTYLFNTMAKNQNIPTTISTDAPIESPNPFRNLYVALTRRSITYKDTEPFIPEEAMTLKTALDAYTKVPAFFRKEEKSLGRIAKGHRADFVIVEGFDVKDLTSLLTTTVRRTYVEGMCVYDVDSH